MSTYNDIDITCAKCGHDFRGTIWTAINARQDPELKDLALGGELNMVMCVECAHVMYQERFLLYQDPSIELVAYVHPTAEKVREDVLKETMMQGFEEAQKVYEKSKRLTYQPVIYFGLASLMESLRVEEARDEESEVAQVICKEHGIPFLTVSPSDARLQKILRLLPGKNDGRTLRRSDLLSGLEQLLKINPAFHFYRELQETVKQVPQWHYASNQPE